MKFEKHVKTTGINGVIYKASNGDLYLRGGMFGNVLMRVPEGMAPVTAAYTRDLDFWMNYRLIQDGSHLLSAELMSARLDPDGTPKEIERVYRDRLANGAFGQRECVINQDAYTLLERRDDVRIYYPEYDDPASEGVEPRSPALVILDAEDRVIGIILGA